MTQSGTGEINQRKSNAPASDAAFRPDLSRPSQISDFNNQREIDSCAFKSAASPVRSLYADFNRPAQIIDFTGGSATDGASRANTAPTPEQTSCPESSDDKISACGAGARLASDRMPNSSVATSEGASSANAERPPALL